MTETSEALKILNAHRMHYAYGDAAACLCGWAPIHAQDWDHEHRVHVAFILTAAMPQPLQDARHAWEEMNPGHWVCKECLTGVDLTRSPDWQPTPSGPSFTASELKERLETATAVALALGRKEAGEEIAEAIESAAHAKGLQVPIRDLGMLPTARQAFIDAATIARDIASRPSQAAPEPLTAPTGHSDPSGMVGGSKTPPRRDATYPMDEPLTGAMKRALAPDYECSCYKLPRAEDGVLRHHPECPNRPADLPEGSDQ